MGHGAVAGEATRKPIVQRWYRIPLPVRVAVLAAGWLSYGALLLSLQAPMTDSRTVGLMTRVCQVGVAVSIVVDIFLPVVFGSVDELVVYSRALRAGALPDGIDHRQWRRRLLRSRLALIGVLLLGYPPVVLGIFSAGDSRSPVAPAVMWGLALSGLGLFGLVIRRLTRIRQLVAVLHQEFLRSVGADSKQSWVTLAGMALPTRVAALIVSGCVIACPAVLLAGFLVHGISGLPDLRWTAAGTAGIVLVVSRLRIADPRLRATPETLKRIVEFDRAYTTGELPQHVDVDEWRRWLEGQRRSDCTNLVWTALFGTLGYLSILGQPSGLHWAAALLFALPACYLVLSWAGRRVLGTRLAYLIQHRDVRQRYG